MKKEVKTFKELEKIFKEMLLLEDDGVLRLLPATFVANQMDNDPVWLMLVASSSGGKSELIQSLNDIMIEDYEMVLPISDLTTNTFASGMKRTGKETSLLNKIPPGGIMTFKDFTSILSKRREDRVTIMSQLREIYDQSYRKETGTGETINWNGKVGAIAGSTEVIYQYLEDLSVMGDRFVMYSIEQPNTDDLTEFVMDYKRSGRSKSEDRERLKAAMKSYCEFVIENYDEQDVDLDEESEEDIMQVADFCTKARSGVIVNYKSGDIEFVPSREMPIRMIDQLLNIAKAFVVMRNTEKGNQKDKTLIEQEKKILYKIAFDSIPIKRRMALKALTKYEGGVRTKGLATEIHYPSRTVSSWLQQLNGLGICKRSAGSGGPKGDLWVMPDKYREVMQKFKHIETVDDVLDGTEKLEDEEINENWEAINEEIDEEQDDIDEFWGTE